MPNRIIKESICTSDTMDALSWFEEVFFYRLVVNCDDYGRMDARPAILRARLFPLKTVTDKQMDTALQSLRSAGIVDLYSVDGKPYLQMRTWEKHQQIRSKKSKFPEPCKHLQADDIKCNQMQSDAPVIQSEYESNPNTNTREKSAPTHARGELLPFGKFANVLLSEDEYNKLKQLIPDFSNYLERFSAKVAAKGYHYEDHYAALCAWYADDKKDEPNSSFDVDEFFQAALERTYGDLRGEFGL